MEKTLRQLRLMLAAGLCMALAACSMQDKPTVHTTDKGTRWHWDGGTIVVETPPRPEGQQNVLGLTAPRLEVVRVGFVGLGMRGDGAVRRFTYIPGTQVVAVPDFTRGHWNDRQGYSHAYAAPADEQEAARKAADFTRRLTGK